MSNEVYANGREVACKAAEGKSICAFPDVCMTPPENPATPPGVPVPYPNTGFASQTTEGSKTVQISGKEVMLKNKSYFKESTGDEAGCAAKKGMITSTNRGKVYFISWSNNVKFEGENAVRHLDMTTHNHASPMANEAVPTVYVDNMAFAFPKSCRAHVDKANATCKGSKKTYKAVQNQDGSGAKRRADGSVEWRSDGLNCDAAEDPAACKKARSCLLPPKKNDRDFCCKEDTTGHHLIEVHCFRAQGMRDESGGALPGLRGYNQEHAPTACASEARGDGTHGVMHAVQSQIEGFFETNGETLRTWRDPGGEGRTNASKWRYKDARDAGAQAHQIAFPHCDPDCIKDQLDAYHKDKAGVDEETELRTDPEAEDRASGNLTKTQKAKLMDYIDSLRA